MENNCRLVTPHISFNTFKYCFENENNFFILPHIS